MFLKSKQVLELHPEQLRAAQTGCVVTKDLFRHTICCQWPRGSSNQLGSHGIAVIMYSNLLLEGGEWERQGCGVEKRKGERPGEPFPNHYHLCISQIVSHYSASTPIQTGTEETRSILPPNWSFPGEALVCKTYFQDRAFLNKQGLKTEATSGRQAGWQAGIDWGRPSSKWADCRVGNKLHQLLVSYLPYVKEER